MGAIYVDQHSARRCRGGVRGGRGVSGDELYSRNKVQSCPWCVFLFVLMYYFVLNIPDG